MKTPNEQIKELIEKIHEETGERVDHFYVDWARACDGNDKVISVSVTIEKDN